VQLKELNMKVFIDWDEMYPVYFIVSKSGMSGYPLPLPELDLPEETLNRWKRVLSEFSQVQEEMHRLVWPLIEEWRRKAEETRCAAQKNGGHL